MGSQSKSSSRKRRTEDSESDSAPPRMSSTSHRHRSRRSHRRSSSPSLESKDRSGRHRKKSLKEYMAKKRRIEITREMERDWRETERKRSAMVVDSQRHVSEMIAEAFSATKKARNPEE